MLKRLIPFLKKSLSDSEPNVAWDAAVAGVPLQQHAAAHPELQQAVGFW